MRTGSTSAMPVTSSRRDRRVRLVTESGETIASTSESNAERMSAALEPHYGPLTVIPA